jgi:predicted SAM-dependent methyltransferase
MKLHLGCGARHIPGLEWIHIDLADYPHIDYRESFDRLPLIPSTSVDLIYCCHALTYFHHEEIPSILKEWKRVLKPKGVLRLSVPEFPTLVEVWYASEYDITKVRGPILGYWKVGGTDQYITYKTLFDYYTLKRVLAQAGFINIKRWDWRKTEHSHIDDYSQAYYPHMDKANGILISLNLECNAP